MRSDDEQALGSCSWAGPIMLIPLPGQGQRRTQSDFVLFLLSFVPISSLEKTTVAKRSLKVMGGNKSKGTQKPLLLPYIRLLNVLLISEGSYHHFLLESGKEVINHLMLNLYRLLNKSEVLRPHAAKQRQREPRAGSRKKRGHFLSRPLEA